MLSENKLKILDDFIDLAEQDLKNLLNDIKPDLKTVNEKLFLEITNIKFKSSETIIGIFDEYIEPMVLYISEDYETDYTWALSYIIDKKDYNTYIQRLRIKKLNNINKDVI